MKQSLTSGLPERLLGPGVPGELLDIGAPQSLNETGKRAKRKNRKWDMRPGSLGGDPRDLQAWAGTGRLGEPPYLGSGS